MLSFMHLIALSHPAARQLSSSWRLACQGLDMESASVFAGALFLQSL